MSRRILLAALLAFLTGAATLALPVPADGEIWAARLLDLSASYGSEAWKYDLAYEGQASPAVVAAHLQNQTSSYYGALGLRLTLKIQLYKLDDASAQPTSSHNVSASIDTTRGPLYALVKREGTSASFFLDFDLDGANNAAPNGKTPPPVEAGLKTVKLNVFRRVADNPRPEPAGETQFQFTYDVPYGAATAPAYGGLLHQQPVPDNIFRLFTDVGWDRSVQYFFRPLEPAQNLELSYEFTSEAAGQSVELYGFIAERGVGSPAGTANTPGPKLPFVPGVSDNQTLQSLVQNADRVVVVNKRLLGTSTVGVDGTVRLTVSGRDLLAVRNQTAAALVAVAPLLVDNFDPARCPGDCRGGAQYRVGATELVVPVTQNKVKVDGYELADPGVTGGQAPAPLRDIAIGVNSLRVRVRDEGGFTAADTRAGDVFAVVPDARSATPLSGSSLSRRQQGTNPNDRETLLTGELSVRTIQAQHVSFYRVLPLLYEANDAFYGAGFGDRGYSVGLNAPATVVPPGAGGVWVNFTSRTTNYDTLAEDPLFELKIYYEVTSPELGVDVSRDVVVREGRTAGEFIPLSSAQEGSFVVTVNSTSGDVLPRANAVNADFRPPEVKRGLVDRIPGVDATALLVALAALVLWARRR